MKPNKFLIIILLIFNGYAFGQDTINKFRRFELPPVQGSSEGEDAIRKNIYVLNKQEKDSIWLSLVEQDKTKTLLSDWKRSESSLIFHPENLLYLMAVLNSNSSNKKIKQKLLRGKIEYDKTHVKDGDDPYYIVPRGGFIKGPRIVMYSSKDDAVQSFIQAHSKANANIFLISRTIFVGEDIKTGKQQVRIDEKAEIPLNKTLNFIRKIEISKVELVIPSPAAVFGGNAGLTIYYHKK